LNNLRDRFSTEQTPSHSSRTLGIQGQK